MNDFKFQVNTNRTDYYVPQKREQEIKVKNKCFLQLGTFENRMWDM